jgi:hypothetical protein
MKTLTNESKARFFAQYWGQSILLLKKSDKDKYPINGRTLFGVDDKSNKSLLLLTPLQKISDEHAIEVAKMSGFVVTNLIKKGHTKPHFDLTDGGFGVCYYEDYYNYVTYEAGQYLQSKGYAVPTYCPIANRIVTVEEQVSEGWIVLKEE